MQCRGILLFLLISAFPTLNPRAQAALDEARMKMAIVEIENAPQGRRRCASGIIISENGFVLTSQTIVPEKSGTVAVRFCNGVQAQAKIVAADAATESRLLQLPTRPTPYVYLELADSDRRWQRCGGQRRWLSADLRAYRRRSDNVARATWRRELHRRRAKN